MSGVDWRAGIVPIDDQWDCLHDVKLCSSFVNALLILSARNRQKATRLLRCEVVEYGWLCALGRGCRSLF